MEIKDKEGQSRTKKDKVGQRRTNLSIAKGVLLKTEKKLSNGDSAVKVKRRHGIQKFAFSLEMKEGPYLHFGG